jgi:hypothetical protein
MPPLTRGIGEPTPHQIPKSDQNHQSKHRISIMQLRKKLKHIGKKIRRRGLYNSLAFGAANALNEPKNI